MRKILILRGVPVAGKTHFALEFIKDNPNYIRISKSEIRKSFGIIKWDRKKEETIKIIEQETTENFLYDGFNIILDDCNMSDKSLEWVYKLKEKCKKDYGWDLEIEIKEIKIPYEEAIRRAANREIPIKEEVILDFYRKYYPEDLPSDIKIPNQELTKGILIISDKQFLDINQDLINKLKDRIDLRIIIGEEI